MNLIELGRKIAATKPFTVETAAELNSQLEAMFGRPNPLGLNDIGHAPMGRDLNDHIGQIVENIGAMQARAEAAGRATKQALEAVAKLTAAIDTIINHIA